MAGSPGSGSEPQKGKKRRRSRRELEGWSGSGEEPAKPGWLGRTSRTPLPCHILGVSSPPHSNISPSHLQPGHWKNYLSHLPGLPQKLWSPHCFQERGAPLHLQLFHLGSGVNIHFLAVPDLQLPRTPQFLSRIKQTGFKGDCLGCMLCGRQHTSRNSLNLHSKPTRRHYFQFTDKGTEV